jgi:hypothetical protein
MLEHWSEAVFLLDILVTKTWNIDPDGVELVFCHGGISVNGKRKKKSDAEERKRLLDDFHNAMSHPETKPTTAMTDMSTKLRELLSRWLKDYKYALQLNKDKRPLTIYILTDGIWKGMSSRALAVDETIKSFNDSLCEAGPFQRKRPVSLQFISFGHDLNAISRLQRLDNDLGYEGVPYELTIPMYT